jgi:hypothetical protein
MYFILSILAGFLAGYLFGKREGIIYGKELGYFCARLQIQRRSLETGTCEICKTPVDCLKSPSVVE